MNDAPRWLRLFTPAEWQSLRRIAHHRLRERLRRGRLYRVATRDYDHWLLNHVVGVAGEWAVREWLGLPVTPLFERFGDDGGIDITLPGGATIAVKANRYWDAYLYFPPFQSPTCDLLVLCARYAPATIGARGFCTRAQFTERAVDRDFHRGCGLQRVVHWKHLDQFDALVRQVRCV